MSSCHNNAVTSRCSVKSVIMKCYRLFFQRLNVNCWSFVFSVNLSYFNTNWNNPVQETTQRRGVKRIEHHGAAGVVHPSKPADGIIKLCVSCTVGMSCTVSVYLVLWVCLVLCVSCTVVCILNCSVSCTVRMSCTVSVYLVLWCVSWTAVCILYCG
jgi:hypothetical protein